MDAVLTLLTLLPLCLAQDVPDRKEQERLVRAYIALDTSDPEQLAEGRGLLEALGGVPFPERRDVKRWNKVLAAALEERLEARPLARKAGEHADSLDGRTGRYFLGGQLKRPKGLFVGLHGGGKGSGDAAMSTGVWSEALEEAGWLGLFPEVLEKTERGWTDAGTEEWVLDLAARAAATFEVDPDRVIIGGHSMGGYGAWTLGAHHADRFAAALAAAGAPSPLYQGGRVVAIEDGVIPSLSALPMLVFQSTDDEKVTPEANQAAVAEVAKARSRFGGFEDFTYWEVHDRGHGLPKGGAAALLERVLGFEREPLPEQVVWQPALSWKRQFYWLRWDEPDLGATVVAKVDRGKNAINVVLRRTQGEGLSVLVNQDLIDLEQPLIVRVNGRKVHEGRVEPTFATWVETSAHGDPGRVFVAEIPLAPR